MTYYTRNGNRFHITEEANLDIRDALPASTFKVNQNPQTGEIYLEDVNDFTLPSKLYGEVEGRSERILNTFLDRPNSTGVLLSGVKGSGKTLLAKKIAAQGALQDLPTIIVDRPFQFDIFNKFIQTIEQPTIILFDEFEKTFDSDDQQNMLTLLDGVYSSRKLFILTVNDKWRINSHMQNRPGRLFYQFEYDGLTEAQIREYSFDQGLDASVIDNIIIICELYSTFTFDMLQALIEEMLRYDETAAEALRHLNISPGADAGRTYVITTTFPDDRNEPNQREEEFAGNPMDFDNWSIYYRGDDSSKNMDVYFNSGDLIRANVAAGVYEFKRDGVVMTFTRKKREYETYYMDKYNAIGAI